MVGGVLAVAIADVVVVVVVVVVGGGGGGGGDGGGGGGGGGGLLWFVLFWFGVLCVFRCVFSCFVGGGTALVDQRYSDCSFEAWKRALVLTSMHREFRTA